MTTPQENAGEVEDVVLTWVSQQNAEVLQEVYVFISLDCPEDLKGKRMKLLNKLINYLSGLEDDTDGDNGLSVYLLINDFIKNIKKETIETKILPEVAKQKEDSLLKSLKRENHIVDVVKLRDFKISGVIGGKTDPLSYTSLLYQIDCGRRLGYSDATICDTVIRAISPSNHLRTYLEGQKTVSV